MAGDSDAGDLDYAHISTGVLPPAEQVQALVDEAHHRFLPVSDGANSTVYPALERADPNRFGVCIVGAGGATFEAGDTRVEFTIMSVVKPFVFALVCEELGPDEAHRLIGVNATGMPFNSLSAVERGAGGRTNPMVNSGAIATTSLVPGASADEKWATILRVLSGFAGRDLAVDEEVYASATATNHRNQAIARLLEAVDAIYWDPAETVDLYTRQCSLGVTAKDLAVMGATLASGGVNPLTGQRVVATVTCHDVLAVMAIAGLYETSGDWLYQVGLPGKSGIGGGIVTVSPGKGGLATYSTPLDGAGNSVRGQLVAHLLSRRLGLDLFVSTRPAFVSWPGPQGDESGGTASSATSTPHS
jgi:glutaminase